jgi:hypothetical protein
VEQQQIISAFSALGQVLEDIIEKNSSSLLNQNEFDQFKALIAKEQHYNGWFTPEQIYLALKEIRPWLRSDALTSWLGSYSFAPQPQTIALILPSNLPLVGFHDFLCVLCAGHKALVKLSSDDARLLPALAHLLCEFEPALKERIQFAPTKLSGFDVVIATGSNNSMLHFRQYFSKNPHLLRGHRTSIAVLDGSETPEELTALGQDIFQYFGKGCRNVTQLWIPENFELNRFFEAILTYCDVINHKKYGNNYDYNKAVHLMNQVPILDNNFLLLKENNELHSPLGMLHYQRYTAKNEVEDFILAHKEQIQCVVGHSYLPFGAAQCPQLIDYADGIDTMQFLGNFA